MSTRTDCSAVVSVHRPGSWKAWRSLQTHLSFLPSPPIYRITFHAGKPRWSRQTLYMPPITSIYTNINILLISHTNGRSNYISVPIVWLTNSTKWEQNITELISLSIEVIKIVYTNTAAITVFQEIRLTIELQTKEFLNVSKGTNDTKPITSSTRRFVFSN